ncbi:hypothetical protein M2157_009436 [Streptomyces sp. SAI-127]|nr:hypothetical protein [Streptomyces sp. SAI-127]
MPEMARVDLGVVDTAVRGLRRPGRRPDGTGLRVSTSRSAVLRLLGALSEPEVPSPRVVGVDEYATRKGRVYGTVLVDVETRRPVDRCLTGRRQAWLHGCRSDLGSRSSAGTARRSSLKAATAGAPQAVQVSDRRHLWNNLGEVSVQPEEKVHCPWRSDRFANRIRARHATVQALPFPAPRSTWLPGTSTSRGSSPRSGCRSSRPLDRARTSPVIGENWRIWWSRSWTTGTTNPGGRRDQRRVSVAGATR